MSIGLSIFIIVVTIGNILASLWLLWWTAKKPKAGPAEGDTTGHTWDGDLKEYNNPLPRWWLYLFFLSGVFCFIYLALYPGLGNFGGLLGWTQEEQWQEEVSAAEEKYSQIYADYANQPIEMLARNPEAMETASRLFANNCSVCHGSDARGANGFPNLRDDDWLYGGTPQAIKTSLTNGRGGVMPPFGSALGPAGVEQVAAYVYSLNGRNAPADLVAAGEQKFQQLCVACHGADAKGNQALGAPNLTDNTWLYGGSLESIKTALTNGRNGKMPAFKDTLGEERVHLLSAYVFSLSSEE